MEKSILAADLLNIMNNTYPKNRITATEAKVLSDSIGQKEKFLTETYDIIRNASSAGARSCSRLINNDTIGTVVFYYNGEKKAEGVLTKIGLECQKLLEQDGYQVELELYKTNLFHIDIKMTLVW